MLLDSLVKLLLPPLEEIPLIIRHCDRGEAVLCDGGAERVIGHLLFRSVHRTGPCQHFARPLVLQGHVMRFLMQSLRLSLHHPFPFTISFSAFVLTSELVETGLDLNLI